MVFCDVSLSSAVVGDGGVVLNASSATAGALSSIISGCSLRHSSVFLRSTLFVYLFVVLSHVVADTTFDSVNRVQ